MNSEYFFYQFQALEIHESQKVADALKRGHYESIVDTGGRLMTEKGVKMMQKAVDKHLRQNQLLLTNEPIWNSISSRDYVSYHR